MNSLFEFAATLSAVLVPCSAVAAVAQTTTLISVDSAGGQGDYLSYSGAISADARFVAFRSDASNLVANDTNISADIFVHDRVAGTTERVSVSTSGVQGDADSEWPAISADGRFVAFESKAVSLGGPDINGQLSDIYLRDRSNSTTEPVSISSAGAMGNSASLGASISADGRFVAFYSFANNLVPGDTNVTVDVFVRDRLNGTTELASAGVEGAQSIDRSRHPSISGSGRFVIFTSRAANLIVADTNGWDDIFMRDRQTATTERVSVSSAGVQGNLGSYYASISPDGNFVAFVSGATNLVAGDTNIQIDVFARDAQANASHFVMQVEAFLPQARRAWVGRRVHFVPLPHEADRS